MKKISSAQHSTIDLQNAIRKLEAFSEQAAKISSAQALSKPIALMKSLLRFSPKVPDQHEVLQAIEVVNRERFLIQKLKEGTPAEQKLAASFTQAIENYNHTRAQLPPPSTGLVALFAKNKLNAVELPKIDLPQIFTVKYLFPAAEEASDSTSHDADLSTEVAVSKQAAELFQMKVISLLERYNIASNHEARHIVKQTPIYTKMENDASRCTLSQMLTLFPGQTIVVKGASSLDPKTLTIQKLFPETFSISFESTQTGFPAPSQRYGWALANALIPEAPQRIDLLTEIADIFHLKKEIISGLLPDGHLVKKAKLLLQLKRHAFKNHPQKFLSLHAELSRSIVLAAPQEWRTVDSLATVDRFYDFLHSHQHAFECLSHCHELICAAYINSPHQTLLSAILKGKDSQFGSPDVKERLAAATSLLDHSIDNAKGSLQGPIERPGNPSSWKVQLDYMACMGKIIGMGSRTIILQYLSEDLIYTPPLLNPFERQLQSSAYHQVKDFSEELHLPIETLSREEQEALLEQMMRESIQKDIQTFAEDHEDSIPEKLSHYFKIRNESLGVIH